MKNLNAPAALQDGMDTLHYSIQEYQVKSERMISDLASVKSSYRFVMVKQKQALKAIIAETKLNMGQTHDPNSTDQHEAKFSLLVESIREIITLSKKMDRYMKKSAADLTLHHKSILSICKVASDIRGKTVDGQAIKTLLKKIEALSEIEEIIDNS